MKTPSERKDVAVVVGDGQRERHLPKKYTCGRREKYGFFAK